MNRILKCAAAFIAVSLCAPAGVSAHVTLETKQARVGSYYKAVLRVPHGCHGSPTLRVRVRIPEGVINVKPQPKPGWTLELVKGDYARPYAAHHGAPVSAGVRELVWSGQLPDEYYDEFVFSSYLSTDLPAGGTLYFPVVQECEKGISRWTDVPGQGGKSPAPGVRLLP